MIAFNTLGTMNKYMRKIHTYVNKYGVVCWAVIYQADMRFRLELVEQLAIEEEVAA